MAGVLISGPAGAGKSETARRILAETEQLAAVADFQSIYAALTLSVRGPDGRYPLRDERLLPLTEYVRRAAITGMQNADIYTILANSDGDPERRRTLLGLLGRGATERVVDPGEQVVRARLADPVSLELSLECEDAIGRWYHHV